MKKIALIFSLFFFGITMLFPQNIEALKEAKPLNFTGSIAAYTSFYNANGIANRSPQSIWGLNGNMNFRLYDNLNLPFSFAVGRYGSQSSYPTFGQIGVSPNYKWATAHLGYRNMNFSPYTLAGHTFLGAGVELKPGKFRIAAMYGRLRNAAEVDTLKSYIIPTFKRIGYGIKVGVGGEDTFFDLIFFRAKDDKNSIETNENNSPNAAENMVVGLTGKVKIFKDLSLNVDIGGSAFTRNLNSKELLLDTLQDTKNYIPNSLFQTRASTRMNFAGKTGITYQNKFFRLQLDYEYIDPEYETMGAYFFANDIERITIAPSWQMFNNKVSVSGSYGRQRNNLLNNRLETTSRNISAVSVDIHPSPKFGLGLNFSNYAIYQEAGTEVLNDSLAFNLSTTTLSATPRLNFQAEKMMHSFMLNTNFQRSNQDNELFYQNSQDFKSITGMLNYTLIFLTTQTSLTGGLNYQTFTVANLETQLLGGMFALNLPLFDQKLNLSLSGNWNARSVNKISDGSVLNGNFNLSYRPAPAHSFGINLGWLQSFSERTSDYSEFRGGLNYVFSILPKKTKS